MKKIEFEFEQNGMIFKDALVLPDDHGLTPDEIDSLKQKRFDDWLAIITAPAPEPTEEKLFPPLQPPELEPKIDITEESFTEESVAEHSTEE